jgi:hypothetical protein
MPLIHTILYAKGWYQRGDLWEDLMCTLKADDYTPDDRQDIVGIITSRLQNFLLQTTGDMAPNYKLSCLLEGLNPHTCWKMGYYTKDHKWAEVTNEYNYEEALVRTYLSMMQMTSVKDLGWEDARPLADPSVLPLKRKN